MTNTVLFVDDEQNVLSSLKRMFLDEEYELFFAAGGEEGLAILKECEIGVIVSDMRMPGMNGVEFLNQAQIIRPDATRIVLSGNADVESIREVINQGGIWRYISKPWDDYEMRMTLKNAMELYDKNRERIFLLHQLKEKNQELTELNQHLELKVQERTLQITSQNSLLNLILDDTSIDKILATSCQILKNLTGIDTIYIYATNLADHFPHDSPIQKSTVTTIVQKLGTKEEPTTIDGFGVIPLIKSEILLGVILIKMQNNHSNEFLQEIYTNVAPVISLALNQHKSVIDAPDIMKNIDTLIDNI